MRANLKGLGLMGVIDQDRRHAGLQPDLPSFSFSGVVLRRLSNARFSDFQKT
jgi:hypothetical protein